MHSRHSAVSGFFEYANQLHKKPNIGLYFKMLEKYQMSFQYLLLQSGQEEKIISHIVAAGSKFG